MKTTILIPARHASSRYPGKPLVRLTLPDGQKQSLIHLTWRAACDVQGPDNVFVVTDDDRIRDEAARIGAQVIMTDPECENGTARCAQALERGNIDTDLVVNFQGDAPLTPPWFVRALIEAMAKDDRADMATPVLQCDARTYAMFLEDRRAGRVGGTTAVFDRDQRALYFSKEVIPRIDLALGADGDIPVFHHVGVYAYRPAALRAYRGWPPGTLEQVEGLEQLRFLENGAHVRCVPVEAPGRLFWEVNHPEDVPRVEAALREIARNRQG